MVFCIENEWKEEEEKKELLNHEKGCRWIFVFFFFYKIRKQIK